MRKTTTFVLLLMTVARVPLADELPSVDALVRQFEAIAFPTTTLYSKREPALLKWEHPLRVHVVADPATADAPYLETIFRGASMAARETRVPISFVPTWDEANFHFLVAPRSYLLGPVLTKPSSLDTQLSDSSECAAGIENGEEDYVGYGIVVAVLESSANRGRQCLSGVFLRALGFEGDGCHYRPSIHCPRDDVEFPSRADLILLGVLYDPRLRNGMGRAEAMPIVREILAKRHEEAGAIAQRALAITPLPDFESLVRQFEATAFLDELGRGRRPAITKWAFPLLLRVIREAEIATVDHVELVRRAVAEVAHTAKWDFSVDSGGQPNLVVYLPTFGELVTRMMARNLGSHAIAVLERNPCFASIDRLFGRGWISRVEIHVAVDVEPAAFEGCLVHELFNAMGLRNDACQYRPSILCEDDDIVHSTASDRLLLRALYDFRIQRGDRTETAMPIFQHILADLYIEALREFW
jgi:hypothetical protein